MKKLLVIIAVLTLILAHTSIAFADNSGPLGPNPLAGDGDPDGSSLDAPNGPNMNVGSESVPMGPAQNSGDGDSDCVGF